MITWSLILLVQNITKLAKEERQILIFCNSHGRVLDLAAVINDVLNGSLGAQETGEGREERLVKQAEDIDNDVDGKDHGATNAAVSSAVLAPAFARLSCNLSDTVASREDTLGQGVDRAEPNEEHKAVKQQKKYTRVLYGEMNQSERMEVVSAFRKRKFQILVSSDVASRGLDIPNISTVSIQKIQ